MNIKYKNNDLGQGSTGVVFHGRLAPSILRVSGMGIEVAVKIVTRAQAFLLLGLSTQLDLDPLIKASEYLFAEASVMLKAGTVTDNVRKCCI